MSERNHSIELIEDGGINPEARAMDVERPEDKLPPAKIEDIFRNIEAGLTEIGKAIDAGNRMRAKVQLASIKTLVTIGTSAAETKNDIELKQRMEQYHGIINGLEEYLLTGTRPSSLPSYSTSSVFCAECGTEISSTDEFCGECGASIKEESVKQDEDL